MSAKSADHFFQLSRDAVGLGDCLRQLATNPGSHRNIDAVGFAALARATNAELRHIDVYGDSLITGRIRPSKQQTYQRSSVAPTGVPEITVPGGKEKGGGRAFSQSR